MNNIVRVVLDKSLDETCYEILDSLDMDADFFLIVYTNPNVDINTILKNEETIRKIVDNYNKKQEDFIKQFPDYTPRYITYNELMDNIKYLTTESYKTVYDEEFDEIIHTDEDYTIKEKEEMENEFLKNNTNTNLSYIFYGDVNKYNIDTVKEQYKNFNKIYVNESSGLVPIEDYDNIFVYDELVDSIEKLDLSPFERYILIYDLVREKTYKEEEKGALNAESRSKYSALNGDTIVCSGYAEVSNNLSNKLDIKSMIDYLARKDNSPYGHARCLVYLKDDKYKIDGLYYADPTMDYRRKDDDYKYLYHYSGFLKTKDFMDKIDNMNNRIDLSLEFLDSLESDNYDEFANVDEDFFLYCMNKMKNMIGDKKRLNYFNDQTRQFRSLKGFLKNMILGTDDEDQIKYFLRNHKEEFYDMFHREIPISSFVKALTKVRYIENKINPDKYPLDLEKLFVNSNKYFFDYDEDRLYFESFTAEEKLLNCIFGETPNKPKNKEAIIEGIGRIILNEANETKRLYNNNLIKVTGSFKLYNEVNKDESNKR